MTDEQSAARTIRALMRQRNVAQTDLAQLLDLPQSGISDRLRGKTPFKETELRKIAAYLEVHASQLLEPPALLVDDEGEASDER